jgi:hypothetical protein
LVRISTSEPLAASALAPGTNFFVEPGAPPGLARFEGPRNFAEQKIRIE